MRFVDPIGFMTIAAFVLSLEAFVADGYSSPRADRHCPLPVHVFWFNYQNIWLAMTDGITEKSGIPTPIESRWPRYSLPTTIVSLWLSVAYWSLDRPRLNA